MPRIQPILHALDVRVAHTRHALCGTADCLCSLLCAALAVGMPQVPVRAVVLPLLDDEAAMALHMAVRAALRPLLSEDSVWWQDPAILHATLFHASSHMVRARARHACAQLHLLQPHTTACLSSLGAAAAHS